MRKTEIIVSTSTYDSGSIDTEAFGSCSVAMTGSCAQHPRESVSMTTQCALYWNCTII